MAVTTDASEPGMQTPVKVLGSKEINMQQEIGTRTLLPVARHPAPPRQQAPICAE
jgi:hypothetical protein